MVNIIQRTPIPVQQSSIALQQYLNHQLTSHQLIQIAETLLESLLEGEYRHEQAIAFIQLRDILSDITAQWESLLGNLHQGSTPTQPPEFPPEWIHQWLTQINAIALPSIAPPTMTEASKNQPIFNINQVGNLNTGDVEIQGDQIGIQHNYAAQQNLAEAAAEIQQLLNQLATTYPSTYLYEFEQQIPSNTRLRDTLIAGGIELLKILCPAAGIPIEMGMKWLETAKR
jgi:hypothetical protein